jgi:hypothetical protein
MFVIEKNVPVPESAFSLGVPWDLMAEGDSVLVEDYSLKHVQSVANKNGLKLNKRFFCLKEQGMVRVWCVEVVPSGVKGIVHDKLKRIKSATFGVLVNQLRKCDKDQIQGALDELVKDGKVSVKYRVHPRRMSKISEYKVI